MARNVYPDPKFVAFSQTQVFMLPDSAKRRALAHEPRMVPALTNLAVLLAPLERPDEALETVQARRRLKPDSLEACEHLALILILRGEYEEAIEALNEAKALTEDEEALMWIANNLEYCRYHLERGQ
jgi:tetratricopeptide (TPR) repeat protein